jgi:hypothetical protein
VVSAEAEQIQLQRKATHPSFSLSNNPGPKMPWDVTNEKTVNATLQSMQLSLQFPYRFSSRRIQA